MYDLFGNPEDRFSRDMAHLFYVCRGQTALHKAAWYQRRTICCMLVEAKASLSRKDYQGNTPRMQALKADDRELAAYLESKNPIYVVLLLYRG